MKVNKINVLGMVIIIFLGISEFFFIKEIVKADQHRGFYMLAL
jgi:hypothetical protein